MSKGGAHHTEIHPLRPRNPSVRRTTRRWRCSFHWDTRNGHPRTYGWKKLGETPKRRQWGFTETCRKPSSSKVLTFTITKGTAKFTSILRKIKGWEHAVNKPIVSPLNVFFSFNYPICYLWFCICAVFRLVHQGHFKPATSPCSKEKKSVCFLQDRIDHSGGQELNPLYRLVLISGG